MPTVLVIAKHAPENCAMHNEEARKATLALFDKQEELHKKYGTKMLGGWIISNEHTVIWVFEIPSLDELEQYFLEPVMKAQSAFNTTEVKIVKSMKEIAKLLQQQ
jgi:hypothetical protein